ncbi:hypothetical protein LJR220_002970 [Bradyrhizobium sp. LjRoot220]|uniref:hypothetical protein n=1 Tax=Bradyrhizobium sp. LjRoot220 TaxID=3342284 RepID=UPI003ECFBBA1
MAAMTETTSLPAPPPIPSAQRGLDLHIVLIIIAVLEVLDGLSVAWAIFGDPEIVVSGLSGAASVMHPLLALAALLFAATGRVRPAIVELGAVIIVTWLMFMPTVVSSGMDLTGIGVIWWPAQIIIFPLLAVHRLCHAQPAVGPCHRTGQHSHLVQRRRRDGACDPGHHSRLLTPAKQ